MCARIVLTLIGLIGFSAFANPQVVTIDTREGVKQTFLLVSPSGPPKVALIMLPGGSGRVNIRIKEGEILFGKNAFLQRTMDQFVANGMLVALVDTPSDQQDMSVQFRKTEDHVRDIEGVISNIRQGHRDIPVYLIGISRGGVSVAYIARHLGAKVAGIVSMSGHLADRNSVGLLGFDYKALKQRILMVSHKNEGCPHTRYSDWLDVAKKYNIPLISVTGGYQQLEKSAGDRFPECRSWAHHNFLGIERPVSAEISNWILQKPFRTEVNE